jgi:hypothetical protein
MKQQSKLSQEQQQQQNAAGQQAGQQAAREFASAEELLRYDADQTTVPPEIARRLQKSAAALPGPKPAWWKRLFGGTRS